MEERDKPTQEQKELWSKDPKYWKWGIFYFNTEDKRIFPPKRIKSMGWTTNFANLYSVLVLIAMILLILSIAFYLRNL